MEDRLLSEILNMPSEYPNDAELGKNIREAVRKYKDLLISQSNKETTNKNNSHGSES